MILGEKLGEAGPVMHCPESGEDPGGVGMTAPSEHALRECCLGALGCVLAVTRGRHPKRAQVLVDRSLEHHRKGLPASVCVCLCACVCMRACLPPPPLHTHRHTHTHTHIHSCIHQLPASCKEPGFTDNTQSHSPSFLIPLSFSFWVLRCHKQTEWARL